MEENAESMLKKIAVTGPECSGKTTLCRALAANFSCLWVPEMARTALEKNGPSYDAVSVEEMARLQMEEERRLERIASMAGHPWLFCDTDLLVYQIWMEQRFGFCPDWIRERASNPDYSLILLLVPDLPWEEDPLRENPFNRNVLYDLYENELMKGNTNWNCIGGTDRLEKAIRLIGEIPV